MFSRSYYAVLRTSGLTALARRLRPGTLVLCYHNVVPVNASPVTGERSLHLPLEERLNTPSTDRWVLGRIDVPSGIPLTAFQAWAAGLRPRARPPG